MGKSLVLAEKPSVAKELAKVLGCRQNGQGCIMGDQYIVTWGLGHLVTLADPEVYSEEYKTWSLESLPMLPKKMELVIIKETSKQYHIVQSLVRRPDVSEIIIATDSGREGELVARWILIKAGCNKPMKRLWISSQTDKAVREGFRNLKPAGDYYNLFLSAVSRAEADWLVGLNVTRALTCKHNASLSAGRVQTPTLAMIVAREQEIKRFIPKEYYTIKANFGGLSAVWKGSNNQSRLFDRSVAEAVMQKTSGKPGMVAQINKQYKHKAPPAAYDLTELQRDANRKYAYSAKQTLSLMQSLYEQHKLLTYPRTDSRYVTDDIIATLPDRLSAIAIGPYRDLALSLRRNRPLSTRYLVDNSKVSDHHAIIPTEEPVFLSKLTPEERNIYDLVVRRFLAVLSPGFEYEETRLTILIGKERFYAKGKIVKAQGWKQAYGQSMTDESDTDDEDEDDSDMDDQTLPQIRQGDKLDVKSCVIQTGKTKPPARYNEATLLTAMENPVGKQMSDDTSGSLQTTGGLGTQSARGLSKTMGELETSATRGISRTTSKLGAPTARDVQKTTNGIGAPISRNIPGTTSGYGMSAAHAIPKTMCELGTPATRADIIEKLFDSFYIERHGKEIVPTSKGIQLIAIVPPDLKSAELTGSWEQELALISKGKSKSDAFIAGMRDYTSKLVSSVVSSDAKYVHDNMTREKCPECEKFLLEVKGKKGIMRICPDRECGYRRNVSIETNARCPNCNKRLTLRGDGEKRIFFCICGHRERVSDFEKRRAGAGASKSDVKKYLESQKRQNGNTGQSALAAQLAKWKEKYQDDDGTPE